MNYFDNVQAAMTEIGKDPDIVFCGYNTRFGKGGGAFNGVSEEKLLEFPLAENLMTGAALGLSLDGKIPVVYFERCDFLIHGLDQIVNHFDKLRVISEGIHRPAAIFRIVVGNKHTPLFTGPTHTQDFSKALKEMVGFPVITLRWKTDIMPAYVKALELAKKGTCTAIFEYKDLFQAQ